MPPEIRRWGQPYKDFIRQWQHLAAVRIPYDLRPNEHRLAAWMEDKSEEILREMGAERFWKGPRFSGVVSSHDLGGCRLGEDPTKSVVNPELRVHDTPGLYVFSGAVFPSCPGVNPTLTMWAVCCRAAEQLVARLKQGSEP